MEKHQLVPDILDVVPKELLKITYPTGVKVNGGNELGPVQVKDCPTVTWTADPNELYTLVMTDPDAPSRADPALREIRHWWVINIPGNRVREGQTLFEYVGSGPPKDSGLHRYIFLVFQQKDRIQSNIHASKTDREDRIKTSTRKLIEQYDLGEPVAGNLYQAQYDEYVGLMQKIRARQSSQQ